MSLAGSLTAAARLAVPAVMRGVREGLSVSRIADAVRSGGIRIANESLRGLIRAEREIWRHGNSLRYVNLDSVPNPRSLPEALTTIRRNLSYTVEVRGTLTSTGKEWIQNVTVATDRNLTRRQIETAARKAISTAKERYGMDIESVILIRGVRAGSAGTL